MSKEKLVYTDEAGNKLFKKYIKIRHRWQYIGKNREGKVVNMDALKTLMRKAKLKGKIKIIEERKTQYKTSSMIPSFEDLMRM